MTALIWMVGETIVQGKKFNTLADAKVWWTDYRNPSSKHLIHNGLLYPATLEGFEQARIGFTT